MNWVHIITCINYRSEPKSIRTRRRLNGECPLEVIDNLINYSINNLINNLYFIETLNFSVLGNRNHRYWKILWSNRAPN